jgi:hypothetical protein
MSCFGEKLLSASCVALRSLFRAQSVQTSKRVGAIAEQTRHNSYPMYMFANLWPLWLMPICLYGIWNPWAGDEEALLLLLGEASRHLFMDEARLAATSFLSTHRALTVRHNCADFRV